MLADLVIIPVGNGTHTSGPLAGVLKLVKESGLPYQLTPTCTCIEGSWDEIMALARRCHEAVKAESPHLMTLLRIEDDASQTRKLERNPESVEEAAGERFAKTPEAAAAPATP